MDIAEQKVISNTKTAKPKAIGASGHALAVLLIREAEKAGEREIKEAESRKATLQRIDKFTRDDHLEFRKTLDDRTKLLQEMADVSGFTLNAYCGMDAKANSVRVTISLWRKMSEAVEAGFKPDYKQSWAFISASATEVRQSKGAPSPDVDKPQAAGPTKRKAGRIAISNVDKAKKMLGEFPLQDLQTIHTWLGEEIKAKMTRIVAKVPKETTGGVPPVSGQSKPAGTPTDKPSEAANQPQEKAAAKK